MNRLQLGPVALHGLKLGRYLVRVPVGAGAKALQTMVTITRHGHIIPSRTPAVTAAGACQTAPALGFAAAAPLGPKRATGNPSAQTSRAASPPPQHRPGGIRTQLSHATAQVVDSVEQPAWTTLAIAFVCLVVLGGMLLLFPVARHVRERYAAPAARARR
ncbi:MAG TPA: hypothetical protein VGU02_15755 [Gaiellaceae bacterium]|nr:hypothetical protein [Gaiellaceae bacterium]